MFTLTTRPLLGSTPTGGEPDWLQQAVGGGGGGSGGVRLKKRKPHKAPPRKTVATPLSWMSKVKRRSSMDLEDEAVEASVAVAKAAVAPGGWLQMGALGAPDVVEEEKALGEARAASSLER